MRAKKHIGDFETSTGNIDGSTNVYLWGVKSTDNKDIYHGVNLYEFFSTIEFYKIKEILFHNLKFDGKFILHHLLENGFTPIDNPFGTPEDENTFTMLETDKGIIFSIIVNVNGHVIKFGDTARLLASSVDDMGKVLGLPKLTIDYNLYKHFDTIHDVPPILLDYLWRDIDIVIEFYNRFRKQYKTQGITLSSTAMKDFKKHYGKNDFIKKFGGYYFHPYTKKKTYNRVLTIEEWDEIKKSYRGGLTVFNRKYLGVEIDLMKTFNRKYGYSVDYNSLYPAIMKDNLMPIGKPMEYKPYANNILSLHKIYIKKATIKRDTLPAIIPSNYDRTKYDINHLTEVEDEYYNIWEWELEMWEKFYNMDYRIVKTWYFEGEYVFTTWVNKVKHMKEDAKNPVDRQNAKILQNSLYGKWGQNWRKIYKIIVEDPDGELSGTRYNDIWVETNKVSETEDLSYIPIGSAITAYARTKLCDAILKNEDTFLYGDTDSLYLSDVPKDLELHDNKYGALKYEKKFTKFKYIKAKAYIAQLDSVYDKGEWHKKDGLHVALGGLSKESHSLITFENFHRGFVIENGQKQGKNVKGGITLQDINYTL